MHSTITPRVALANTMKRFGLLAFLFFFAKGMLWLTLIAASASGLLAL